MAKLKFKNIIGIIIVTVLIVINFIFLLTPKSVVSHPENTQIYSVIYEDRDITNQINQIDLIDYLADIKCKRTFDRFSPMLMLCSDITMRIDFIDNGRTVHVILGNKNIRYESANKNGYIILS